MNEVRKALSRSCFGVTFGGVLVEQGIGNRVRKIRFGSPAIEIAASDAKSTFVD
jgi:carbamoylphosphate synthase small subunit